MVKKTEEGYIVVETALSFTLFILLVVSILSLINIVTIQARIHYALTQTANELSMYSYVLDALGLSGDIKGLDKTGHEVQEKIDGVIEDLKTIERGVTTVPGSTGAFFDNLDALTDAVRSLSNTAGEIADDPKGTFVKVVRYGLNGAKNYGMQELVIRPMIGKYLKNGTQDGEEYLNSCGINGLDGLELGKCVFIDSKGDITIVASYDIDYSFGLLPLSFTKIHVEQTAKTSAWLGGKSE